MTEAQFQRQVIELAELYGWLVYHTHDSRRSQPGFPDLVLVRDRVLYRELKTDTGKIRPDQRTWLIRLSEAGADAEIWRPSEWDGIAQELSGKKPPRMECGKG